MVHKSSAAQALRQAILAERPLIHACEAIESNVLTQIAQPEAIEA
ncbi:hypothetical protein [Granulicella sp. dw_53]|nr:hypothetical protein [Granulicella sp. dw_53]